jgi:hypothetical protein
VATSDDIGVKFALTTGEVAAAVRFLMIRGRQIKVFIVIGLILVAVGAIGRTYTLLALGAWFILFSIFLVAAMPFLAARRQKVLRGEQSVTLSAQGITTEFALGKSELDWKFFTAVRVQGKLLVIYGPDRRIVPIPTRAFSSEAQLESARSFAERHIAAAA